jgi:hypothetical protein
MNRSVNPEIVRTNLLKLSKMSLGLDRDGTLARQPSDRPDTINVAATRSRKDERVFLLRHRPATQLAWLLTRH